MLKGPHLQNDANGVYLDGTKVYKGCSLPPSPETWLCTLDSGGREEKKCVQMKAEDTDFSELRS